MDIHFCWDKVSSVSINLSHTEKCDCGKKAAAKCCKEVQFTVKISDSQKISAQNSSEKKSSSIKIFNEFASSFSATQSNNLSQNIFAHQVQLPDKSKHPVYLSTHSLLI